MYGSVRGLCLCLCACLCLCLCPRLWPISTSMSKSMHLYTPTIHARGGLRFPKPLSIAALTIDPRPNRSAASSVGEGGPSGRVLANRPAKHARGGLQQIIPWRASTDYPLGHTLQGPANHLRLLKNFLATTKTRHVPHTHHIRPKCIFPRRRAKSPTAITHCYELTCGRSFDRAWGWCSYVLGSGLVLGVRASVSCLRLGLQALGFEGLGLLQVEGAALLLLGALRLAGGRRVL